MTDAASSSRQGQARNGGAPRRFGRRTWRLFLLSLLPLPPFLWLLALALSRRERPCVSDKIAAAIMFLCIAAVMYLFVHLTVVARAAAMRRLNISADELALLGITVAIGVGTYLSIAKTFFTWECP